MSSQSSRFFHVTASLIVLLVGGAIVLLLVLKQRRLQEEARSRAEQVERGPLVATALSARGAEVRRVILVGEARPYKTTTLYSKVSGYLTHITVDAGDHVVPGQLIAQISSPELDAQYRSAAVTMSSRQRIEERTRGLVEKGLLSEQALDDAATNSRTQENAFREISAVRNYRNLTAPFAGVVTKRYVDTGALITNATNNQTSAQPVVTISDTTQLRVTVFIDQVNASHVKRGVRAEITDSANPAITTLAEVSRISGELDARTHTMAAEVDFDNSSGIFLSGSFVTVSLLLPSTGFIEVPNAALLTREGKSYVAVLTKDDRVNLRPIEIAGTDGKVLRIAGGIVEGTRVALNLPTSIANNSRVTTADRCERAPVAQPDSGPRNGEGVGRTAAVSALGSAC